MTKVLSDLEEEAGKEKDMTHQNPERRHRDPSPSDPLGTNSEIARKLKRYYDELVSDDVPDRFSELLEALEKQEPSKSDTKED